MQMMDPHQGHRFPDNPQPPQERRFASNMPPQAQAQAQGYEQQGRMPGTAPVMPPLTYPTGQLQALHGTQPVSTMPPMTTARQGEISATAVQGTPLIVYTMQGVAVAVTDAEMQRVLDAQAAKSAQEQQGDQKQKGRQRGKQKSRQKKEIRGKKEQKGSFAIKFSVVWFVFGVIGVVSTALAAYEWVVIPFLVWLHQVTGGAL